MEENGSDYDQSNNDNSVDDPVSKPKKKSRKKSSSDIKVARDDQCQWLVVQEAVLIERLQENIAKKSGMSFLPVV